MKAPEVGGASVPAVLKEGQPGPHPGAPLRPAGSVAGSRLNVPDMPGKDMEPGIQISLRACGEPALLRVIRASVDPAVDLLDLPAKVTKLRKSLGLEEGYGHGDHGQGQNTAGVLDGLVRVRDYGVDGSSHVLLQKRKSPFRGYFGSCLALAFQASMASLSVSKSRVFAGHPTLLQETRHTSAMPTNVSINTHSVYAECPQRGHGFKAMAIPSVRGVRVWGQNIQLHLVQMCKTSSRSKTLIRLFDKSSI